MAGNDFFERISSNWIVKILSIAAAVVLFVFHRIGSIEERFLSVPLEYEVNNEFIVTDISTDVVRIDIRGGGDEIFLVLGEDIRGYVDLTSYTSEGIFKAPVLVEKTGSARTVDVELIVEPLEVTVTLERRVERELSVAPNLLGYPAAGYQLVRYMVTPETVKVSGPRSSLSGLERLETTEIGLSGRTSDFTIRVPVMTRDESIVFSGSPIVEVKGFIRETVIERAFEAVPIEYTNLDLDLELELEEAVLFGTLSVSGPQLLVESLQPRDVKLVVNCDSIDSPGTYELAVSAATPPRITPVTIQPVMVELEVVEMTPEVPDEEISGSDSPLSGPFAEQREAATGAVEWDDDL